jgi:uncharacterized repeat protein (TIGR04076 family)
MPKIIAKVVSQKGTCQAGHKVGNEFVIGQTTPEGMCSWAFVAVFPYAEALEFGGAFPWESRPDRARVACTDPDNPVIFELRRVED